MVNAIKISMTQRVIVSLVLIHKFVKNAKEQLKMTVLYVILAIFLKKINVLNNVKKIPIFFNQIMVMLNVLSVKKKMLLI